MRRRNTAGIYLGGWATSAKGSPSEEPGPDLASYPLSQVPDEAAVLVRALLTADRNQHFARARQDGRDGSAPVDFRPFIIADADTGHGGDAHVRNLIRRFVEVGVPGYHIEDQRPGTKKCGHQGGKVLVASDEQIKRLNAARFQLDLMGVGGIIVATLAPGILLSFTHGPLFDLATATIPPGRGWAVFAHFMLELVLPSMLVGAALGWWLGGSVKSALVMALGHELGPAGIRINMVALGVLEGGTSRDLATRRRRDYETFSALRRIVLLSWHSLSWSPNATCWLKMSGSTSVNCCVNPDHPADTDSVGP